MIKVLLADDHAIVTEGFAALLKEEKGVVVVGNAANGEEVLEKLSKMEVHVVVLDIRMPKLNGIETAKIIKKDFPDVKILVYTSYDHQDYILTFTEIGAEGYMLKEEGKIEDILYAIKELAAGEEYWSPKVSKILRDSLRPGASKKEKVILTPREIDVLKLIASDHTSGEIAAKLNIEVTTVDTHRRHLIKKTKVKSSLGLVKYAIDNGYLENTQDE